MHRSFVDPRADPDPAAQRPPARFTSNPDELNALHQLCREGRLYDVERYLQADGPVQLCPSTRISGRRNFHSALEIAFSRHNQALLLLLLANGYDLAAEQQCPLDSALRLRRKDMVDLLLRWGADPHRASVHILCDSYDSELFERFLNLGVDFTAGHALAEALGEHTSNKPLFGFAKRHRIRDPKIQIDLDMALVHQAQNGKEKGVLLCLWAGANPHTPVPGLDQWYADIEDPDEWSSAIYAACSAGHAAILKRLGPDPALDDYEELYRSACNGETIEILALSQLPREPSTVILRQIGRTTLLHFEAYRPVEVLKALFEAGVRWESSSKREIGEARRDLLQSSYSTFEEVLKLLSTKDYCSREVLTELARTPSIRRRMQKQHLIPDSGTFSSGWSTLSRESLAKFGIDRPKAKRRQ